MTTVGPWALCLSLYRYFSMGPSLTFPDAKDKFTYTYTQSAQDLMSKSEIYLSAVKPEESNGEALNVADTAPRRSWSIKWSFIASYFGPNGIDAGQLGGEQVDLLWNEHQHDYRNVQDIWTCSSRDASIFMCLLQVRLYFA